MTLEQLTLEQLMDQVRDAPEGVSQIPAFDELYRRTADDFRKRCVRMTGKHHLGEELAQTTWLKILASRKTWWAGNFNAWRSKIARCEYIRWALFQREYNPLSALEVYRELEPHDRGVVRYVFWPNPPRDKKSRDGGRDLTLSQEFKHLFERLDAEDFPLLPSRGLLSHLGRKLRRPENTYVRAALRLKLSEKRVGQICSEFRANVRTYVQQLQLEEARIVSHASDPNYLIDLVEVVLCVYWTYDARDRMVIRWYAWPRWEFDRSLGTGDSHEDGAARQERNGLLMKRHKALRPTREMAEYLAQGFFDHYGKYQHAEDEINVATPTAWRVIRKLLEDVQVKLFRDVNIKPAQLPKEFST